MTVIEIVNAARAILKDELASGRTFPDDSSSFFKDSEMLQWLNWSQQELQTKLVQSFENRFTTATTISLVTGQEAYDMPCGCLKVLRVEDITNCNAPIEVIPMSFNDKDKYNYNSFFTNSGVGAVEKYAILGEKLIFRKIPSVVTVNSIKVHYVKRLDDLTTGSETSDIPKEYHELLMWGVVENGLIKQEATAEATGVILARRNRLVSDLITSSEDRQVQRSRQIKRKKFWGK